jgi:hypothetical protein
MAEEEEETPFELQDLGHIWWSSSNSTTSTTPSCSSNNKNNKIALSDSDEEPLSPSTLLQSQINTTSEGKAKNGPQNGKIKLKKFIKLASLPFHITGGTGKNNKYKQFV